MIDNTSTFPPETTKAGKTPIPKPEPSEADRIIAEIKELEKLTDRYRMRRDHAERVMHKCGAQLTVLRRQLGDKLEELAGG